MSKKPRIPKRGKHLMIWVLKPQKEGRRAFAIGKNFGKSLDLQEIER